MTAVTGLELRSLLLVVLSASSVTTYNCSFGWFGITCSLKCNCNEQDCDKDTGNCLNGKPCESGFFGLGCQFVDLRQIYSHPDNPEFLKDDKYSTCNPDKQSLSLTVKTEVPYRLQYFQLLVATDSERNFTLQVTVNNSVNLCTDMHKYSIDNTTVDVFCGDDVMADTIVFEGGIVPDLCHIFVSTGRNVALKQNATMQSSSPEDNGGPGAAVDGSTNPDASKLSCSNTDKDSRGGWWKLTFSTPYKLNLVMIYNRDLFAFRIVGFVVNLLNTHGQSLYVYKDHYKWVSSVYILPMPKVEAVKHVYMDKSVVLADMDNRRMTLCEVQTYSHGNGVIKNQNDYLCIKNDSCFRHDIEIIAHCRTELNE